MSLKTTVSKSDWLAAEQCVGMAWYALRADVAVRGEAERFRMEEGRRVGALARELYPQGIMVPPAEVRAAAERTSQLVSDGKEEVLFEAAAHADRLAARADIIRRTEDGWQVLEVKSSFSDTKDLPDLVDDLAYTLLVFRRGGIPVKRAGLLLLDRAFRYGEGPDRLFHYVDETTDAFERAAEFDAHADARVNVLFGDTPPSPVLGSACRRCEYFAERCLGKGVAHTVLELPGLHAKKLARLSGDGIVDMSAVPEDLQLNDRQIRARSSVLSDTIMVDPSLGADLQAIRWPCSYLDFETVATTLPLYPARACHEQVVTQFSVHSREAVGADLEHSEYLADATKDCEKELAQALIAALPGQGSILVYSDFEARRINALSEKLPDLAGPLDMILARLVDLLAIIKENVYHPDFRGSFSIKTVLPALVPDLSYDSLSIADGDTAIARFARMARGEISGNEIETTRRHLLEYCCLDTLAMVRLHDELRKLASS